MPDGGFVFIGETSSFGAGNYDIWLVRTDSEGETLWTRTFGGFFNEYGHAIELTAEGNLLLKGQKQFCESENVGTQCRDRAWVLLTNAEGEEVREWLGSDPLKEGKW